MKFFFTLVFLIFTIFFVNGQVGINTTNPNSSAILDITATDKGVLFPRVDLGNLSTAAPVTAPARGLTVWNTDAAASGANEGLYYWNGTNSWVRLNTGATPAAPSTGWSLTGNSVSNSNFLGSTNYESLFMRVNDRQVLKFHPQAGAISLGFGASANDNRGIAIGNTAVNASGNDAIAIGTSSTTNSQNSIAIGLNTSTTGNESIAIGTRARTNSLNNIAIGLDATSTGNNATAIGHRATVSKAEAIVLGRTDITDRTAFDYSRVGLGTTSPDEKLHVVGKLKLVDGTQANGRVLTSDANGVASWQPNNASAPSYADVKLNNNITVNLVSANTVPISAPATSISSSDINTSTAALTATPTVTGLYKITYNVTFQTSSGNRDVQFFLTENTNRIAGTEHDVFTNNQDRGISVTTIRTLNANQTYGIGGISLSSGTSRMIISANRTAIVIEKL